MTWLLLAILTIGVSAYVVAPLYRAPTGPSSEADPELDEARRQLAQLDADLEAGRLTPESADETRRALDLRVLDRLDKVRPAAPSRARSSSVVKIAVPAVLAVSGLGLYALLGSPDFQSRLQPPAPDPALQALQSQSLPELVANLEQTLARDPNPPVEGVVLLARSKMTLGQFDAAFAAYDRALELSGGDASIADEKARAEAYAANQMPAIDDATREAVAAMSADDRDAMISGMVERLASRLAEDPADPAGWLRLLRARLVLGQDEQARADLAFARDALSDDPQAQAVLLEGAAGLGLVIADAPPQPAD